jgi:cell surface protein SprA
LQKSTLHIFSGGLLISFFSWLSFNTIAPTSRYVETTTHKLTSAADTIVKSGKRPRINWRDRATNRLSDPLPSSSLILKDSKNLSNEFVLDSVNKIIVEEKLKSESSDINYRPAERMSYAEFMEAQRKQTTREYWKDYAKRFDGESEVGGRGLSPKIELPPVLDRIFGGSNMNIAPNGNVTIRMGVTNTVSRSPQTPIALQDITRFDFDQNAQINFNGNIGNKIKLNTNFDTRASFNFQNQLKLDWRSEEEDILQNVQLGNTSFQTPSQLIPGVQNLFGVNTKFRFGNLDLNIVLAQQRSKQESVKLRNGSSSKPFELRVDQYDENRHFFLSQFFRDNYERSLRSLPLIASGVRIIRMEVYVTNRTLTPLGLRNVLGVADIGEDKPYSPLLRGNSTGRLTPSSNKSNDFFAKFNGYRTTDQAISTVEAGGLRKGTDYELLRGAKRLTENEYRFSPELGYVSLLAPLKNDEVLAVAYEYAYNGRNYKVGELTEDYINRNDEDVITLKLLKAATLRNDTSIPMWNLMMKNVYSLRTTNLNRQGFQLRVVYKDDLSGVDLPNFNEEGSSIKGRAWTSIFGLDRLNQSNDPQPDGVLDFVEGVTIDSRNGLLIFPVLEPFGNYLSDYLSRNSSSQYVEKYTNDRIYRNTQIEASQNTERNKFFLKGTFQGSGSTGILPMIGGNDPKAVRVTAGGVPLTQGVDYIIDPVTNNVKILNESIAQSGKEIEISYERPELFANQIRSMIGVRADYRLGKDMNLGFTYENMSETPPANIRRVALGSEPIDNQIIGLDLNFRKDSKLLTRLVDALPLISTKESSNIQFQGEYARLIPGISSRVQNNSFIDDFEAARTSFDFARQPLLWRPAATPADFRKTSNINDIASAYRRAKISVYNIDLSYAQQGSPFGNFQPDINPDEIGRFQYEKIIYPQQIFKNKAIPNNIQIPQQTLDISYFPSERGLYNFNTDLDINGLLRNPRENFGAVTRAIGSDTDFENANIETIDFWMLDPFIDGATGVVRDGVFNQRNTTGGKVLLHLGDVSEDFIPDNRFNFENGLPLVDRVVSPQPSPNVDQTPWGYAPRSQFLTDAFDNLSGAREKQDVGLDGLSNTDETTFFSSYLSAVLPRLNNQAQERMRKDPAADDFRFYIGGDAEAFGSNMIRRYKDYLGLENNTPVPVNQQQTQVSQSLGGEITPSINTRPDKEDINTDNTINDAEAYFEYEIDLRPGQLDVGKGYIIDKVNDGSGGTWYQFRIPIRSYKNKTGGINSFRSIRFMRMVMTDFAQPVVMRFAQFQATGYQYRKYLGDLNAKGLGETPEPYNANFKVGTVSIEENGGGKTDINQQLSSPYAVPPGFTQDRDITTFNNARLNEQSMLMSVENLRDGDSRAVFKNTSLDLFNYNKLKMFVHMENPDNEDNQTSVFVRLGTDLTENYYEIETAGLKATNPKTINPTVPQPDLVWPTENEISIALDSVRNIKVLRDAQPNPRYTIPFTRIVNDTDEQLDTLGNVIGTPIKRQFKVTVVGRPSLDAIQTIMIGLRNPQISGDGQRDKTFTVWVNELRGTGFKTQGGEAAIGKMNIKLADFANITLNGALRTFGFGGVHQKLSDRARETTVEYGIAASINLDKLLPQKWGWKIPLYVYHEEKKISPQFNPLDPDVPLEDALRSKPTTEERNKLDRAAADNTVRKGFNLTNVKKVRTDAKKKQKVYDIENFTFSYSYAGTTRTSPTIEEYRQENYKGGITYTYTWQPKSIEPFKKFNTQSQWLSWIKELNISPLPNSIALRSDMDRGFTKSQYRGFDLTSEGQTPFFEKYWYFRRNYNLNWNLTKSIIAQYTANMDAIIDEPEGEIDTPQKRDSLWSSLTRWGRARNYDQSLNFTYRIPTQKFPLTDWLTADFQWKNRFQFTGASYNLRDEDGELIGNVIKNTRERSLSGRIDFIALYNKVKNLRLANTPSPPRKNIARNPGDDEDIQKEQPRLAKSVLRALMAIRGIQYNIGIEESTTLPGFLPTSGILGNDWNVAAPGLGFIFGSQDGDIRFRARDNNWLSKSLVQPMPFAQTLNKTFSFKTQIEPFKDFKIQIEGNWKRGETYSEFLRPEVAGGPFVSQNPVRGGNFSMSYLSFWTAFHYDNPDRSNEIFNRFRNYRSIILERLRKDNPQGEFYDLNSQDVLIPAFFAAYAGKDPNNTDYSPFAGFPLPNWRIDYNGLTNYGFFKRTFSSFTLTHSYQSTYSVGNFVSSLEYNNPQLLAFGSQLYQLGNQTIISDVTNVRSLVPVYAMNLISFDEKFSPLLGVNATTKSRITFRFEYGQSRLVQLATNSATMNENTNRNLTASMGFTKKDMVIPFGLRGRRLRLPNDLKFQFTMSVTDSRMILRKLNGENLIQQGSGGYQLRINPTINYDINKSINLQLYFERTVNDPIVSTLFYQSNTSAGFALRFNLEGIGKGVNISVPRAGENQRSNGE